MWLWLMAQSVWLSMNWRRIRSRASFLDDAGSIPEWVMLLIFAAGVTLGLVAVVGPKILEFASNAIDSVNGAPGP